MFNSELKKRIASIEKTISREVVHYNGSTVNSLRLEINGLRNEIEKLKAIVAEVTNTVYEDKK